ncbi:MAG: TrmH family RNA methyltransferase [Candidatus Sumerlaeia bacterium]|nr:TrmH family RNA methyltransferase [Candidatus Sumerlaeia bacterium]
MAPELPVLCLVRPDIAGNVGAVGRLCAVAGWHLAVVRPVPFLLSDRAARRAGLDYWERLDWSDHGSFEAFEEWLGPGRGLVLVETGGPSLFGAAPPPGLPALVLGSETAGLPREVLARHQASVRSLPMPGAGARSLNVAQAAAIAVYETMRRRGELV